MELILSIHWLAYAVYFILLNYFLFSQTSLKKELLPLKSVFRNNFYSLAIILILFLNTAQN